MEQFFADLAASTAPRSGSRRRRLPLPAARRHQPRLSLRSAAARARERAGRGSGQAPASLREADQRRDQGSARATWRSPSICAAATRFQRGHAEGGYEPVAEAMFNELNVDGFFLEYDDARSGDFEPLRFVPKGNKRVVLGIITSKFGALESKDDLKRRIDEAAKYMPLDQMCTQRAMRLREPHRRQSAHRRRAVREAPPRGGAGAGDLATRIAAQAPRTCSIRRSGSDGAESDRHATWPSGRTSTSRR